MNIKRKLKDLPIVFLEKYIKEDGRTLEEYFNITDGKKRNLLINLVKYIITKESEKQPEDIIFSKEEIEKNILFKELDRTLYLDEFFKKSGKNYKLKNLDITKLKEWIKNYERNKENKDCLLDKESLKKNYDKLKDMLTSGNIDHTKFNVLIDEVITLAQKLHWKYLPIYDEQMIENRGLLPEDIKNYYNHYHAIEDLYEYIFDINKIELKDKNGDETLNKELNFKVYTARWNGYDSYRIERTIYGWNVAHISIGGESTKGGEGSLFNNLDHDSVFYPKKGVSFALEKLWKLADDNEINLQELQYKLQEIADWISDVERNLRKKQPDWCNYY
ncbi:MAG: hypothetical protein ACRC6E_01045 [Fusobacteriaceae bacterium]